jgi:putative ABC transport system permease protein
MPSRDPCLVRLSIWLLRVIRPLVPRDTRDDWMREWEGEVRHRWSWIARDRRTRWREEAELVRRAGGAVSDAAYLRREFTWDLDVAHDFRHGLRLLRKRALLSVLAVIVLAIGSGSTIAVFSVVDRLILRDPPYRDPGRVVTIWQTSADTPSEREGASPGAFIAWRERATSFEAIAAVEPFSFDYLAGSEPETLLGGLVTERFFEALGVVPLLGRTFRSEEHVAGRADIAILSYGGWQRLFGGDAGIVGRVVQLEERPFIIVGVLPQWFDPNLLERTRPREVYAPKALQDFERRSFRSRYWNVVARLKPEPTIDRAEQELRAVSTQLAAENPRTMTRMTAAVVPLAEHLSGSARGPLLILFGAIVLVLLIACANVASLLLAGASERRREFAIRTALGAGPGRIVRQVLVESFTLACLASVAGIIVAKWAVGAVVRFGPHVAQLDQVAIDGRILAFALALTAGTALFFGTAPALQAGQPSQQAMKDSSTTGTASRPRRRFGSVLVVAEVSLAMVLLVGAGLLLRSFVAVAKIDPGFTRSNVIAMQVFTYGPRYASGDRLRAFYDQALERARAVPGVQAAGLVSAMPLLSSNINIEGGFRVEGRPAPPPTEQQTTFISIATGDYFRAMGIPLKNGRLFAETDTPSGRPVAIVNDLIAQRHWPGANPVGERITINWQGRWLTLDVVGVVGRLRHDALDREARPEVFMPFAQTPFGSMTFVVRTAGDPAAIVPPVKTAVWTLDPTLAFYDIATIDTLLAQSLSARRFLLWLLTGFAGLAFALAAAGIYGVLTFTTLQRRREMGVRLAMGASGRDIATLVVGEGMTLVGIGVAVGLLASIASTRLLTAFLFGVTPIDPLTLAAAVLLIGVVAFAACYIPARRATRMDPLIVLRAE